MKILVAVDGSRYTKRMLAYLAAHDEWLGDTHDYVVIHAVPPLPPHIASSLGKDAVKDYYLDEGEKVLKPVRAFFAKQRIKAEFVPKVGHAAEVIASMAERSFSLVMLGSHGHGALGNLVLGSVATKVMAHCETPVLLVR